MKLQAWLDKEDRSRRWFARQFTTPTVTSTSVDQWCDGRIPKECYWKTITTVTGGAVAKKDFTTTPTKKEKTHHENRSTKAGRKERIGREIQGRSEA